MKLKNIQSVLLLVALIFAASVSITQAESNVGTNTEVNPTTATPKAEPAFLHPNSKGMKEVRNDIRIDKVNAIKDIRIDTRTDIKDLRDKMIDARKNASTTEEKKQIMQNFKGVRDEKIKSMKIDAFKFRKEALAKQLNLTFTNLTNIRGKINDALIKKEASGKDVTAARAKLVVADEKIAGADVAIKALISLPLPTTSTSTISLTKPRAEGDAAITALKVARTALKDVLIALRPQGETEASTTTKINQ